jgi:hypothetical protein
LKFFGKIIGSAVFNASYKDFAYANTEGGLISEDIFTLFPHYGQRQFQQNRKFQPQNDRSMKARESSLTKIKRHPF